MKLANTAQKFNEIIHVVAFKVACLPYSIIIWLSWFIVVNFSYFQILIFYKY